MDIEWTGQKCPRWQKKITTTLFKTKTKQHKKKQGGRESKVMANFMGISPKSLQSSWLKMIRKTNGVEYVWGFHPACQRRQYCRFGIKS